jgi:hypothetical protein
MDKIKYEEEGFASRGLPLCDDEVPGQSAVEYNASVKATTMKVS